MLPEAGSCWHQFGQYLLCDGAGVGGYILQASDILSPTLGGGAGKPLLRGSAGRAGSAVAAAHLARPAHSGSALLVAVAVGGVFFCLDSAEDRGINLNNHLAWTAESHFLTTDWPQRWVFPGNICPHPVPSQEEGGKGPGASRSSNREDSPYRT